MTTLILFEEPKVQQAKYDEVISLLKKIQHYWSAKIEAIAHFQTMTQEYHLTNQHKPLILGFNPRTKVAKASK